MKLPSYLAFLHDKRGAIGTIAVVIGMVVIGVGILVGSQIRSGNINIAPRASTPTADAIWSQVKPGSNNILPWTNGGPTAGWESYYANRVYICNGEWCWFIDRSNNQTVVGNNGNPIQLSQNADYNNTKAAPDGSRLWTNGGPTAAWTWVLNFNGQTTGGTVNGTVNESMICNKNYCWRYVRTQNGTGSGWRDGGSPIHLPTANDFWKDSRVSALWNGNGVTVAWTDPVNGRVTLCNGNDCRSLEYTTWTWRFNGDKIQPYPSGVTQFTSAWTSPVTNIITQCTANICYQYDINKGAFNAAPILLAAPTATVKPTTPANTVAPTVKVSNPTTTPFIVLKSQNAQGTPVPVRGMSYTYDCGSYPNCFSTPAENTASYTVNAIGTWDGGGGIVLNTNQRLIGVTPNPAGGSQNTKNNNRSNVWFNEATWNNYWWSKYPTTGSRSLTFVIGTVTPAPNTPTPTSFIVLKAQNPQGTPVPVRGLSYTYDCGSYPTCFSTPAENVSSYTVNAIGTWQGGGGVALNTNQRLIGVTPNPVGGVQNIKTNNNKPNSTWMNGVVWNNYWWDKYPTTGSRSVNFVIVTITPTPQQVGNLKVTIPGTVPTGAQWRRTGTTTWFNSGATESNIPTGSYTIEYKDVTGYTKPANQTITVTNGGTSSITAGAYIAIQVSITPSATATATIKPVATSTIGPTTLQCTKRAQGDANCDGAINLADYACIVGELSNRKPTNCKSSDFDGQGGERPNATDYGIWLNNYKQSNNL